MSQAECLDYDTAMAAAHALTPKINAIESRNTIRVTDPGVVVDGKRHYRSETQRVLSAEYFDDFYAWIGSNGQKVGAALYEGGDGSAGGFAVPVIVDQQIIPLAPAELGIRKLAMVIPTVADIKLPRKKTHGTAAGKAEGDGTGSNLFTGTAPTLEQEVLSAYMAGASEDASWELLQDVGTFQTFVVDDLLIAQQQYEENKYINGSGIGEPQGIVAHCDNGVAASGPDSNGNLVSIDATFDIMGTLNAIYHPGAAWLMSRATAIGLRKAQKQSNLFEPVFVRVGNQDFLHGYPVEYSAYMPDAAAGATPVLFGDFKRGYVIGDRGGSGINVKILDQPKALEGLLTLLAFRRTDGRVRRSEAVKSLTLDS